MITLQGQSYYGTTLRQGRFGGVALAETAYGPGLNIPAHRHENAYFCLVLSGFYRERTRQGERPCPTRALLYHGSGSVHSDSFGAAPSRCFNVELAGTEPGTPPSGGAARGLMLHIYREFREPDSHAPAVIDALAQELFAAAAGRAERHHPRWLDTVREALHDAMGTLPPLEELARHAGVHPTHLARAFRRAFGCTAGEYVRKLKVERALIDVLHTGRPLSEIAQRHGYADQCHFTRAFKRVTGTTPGAYRRRR